MTLYWPTAIIVTKDGPDRLFTYDAVNSLDKAEEQFKIWEDHYAYNIAARWIDAKDGKTKEIINKRVNIEHVKALWAQLGNVPINPETEGIENWWGSPLWNNSFRPGTQREDIWHWFEETFDLSVAEDLMMQTNSKDIHPEHSNKKMSAHKKRTVGR